MITLLGAKRSHDEMIGEDSEDSRLFKSAGLLLCITGDER